MSVFVVRADKCLGRPKTWKGCLRVCYFIIKINRKPLVAELNGIRENIGFWVLFQSPFHQNGSGIINM